LAAALNEDLPGAMTIAHEIRFMLKRINTEAVDKAWTGSKCDLEILLGRNSNFDLSLVHDPELCLRFVYRRFDCKEAVIVEQVLAVLKGLFRSWRPSRRLEFISRCEIYPIAHRQRCLLTEATLPSTQEADQWDKWRLEEAENKAAGELVKLAERCRMDV